MSSLLGRERTSSRYTPTPRKPAAVVESALLIIGALIVLFGVYTYYAPTDWVLADLPEGWHLGCFAFGSLLLSGGFSTFADRIRDYDEDRSWLAIIDAILAAAALAAAVVFTVVLIF
jgi:hypothetical protein